MTFFLQNRKKASRILKRNISGNELLGIFDTHENAMKRAVIKHRPGEYINGLNFLVEISTASILLNFSPGRKVESALVYAHFDTGASSTSIDVNLAREMKLDTMGVRNIMTAAGEIPMPAFTVNIGFLGTNLSPFVDLKINSCKLN